MDNPEKQDEEKQIKNTTQYVLDTHYAQTNNVNIDCL